MKPCGPALRPICTHGFFCLDSAHPYIRQSATQLWFADAYMPVCIRMRDSLAANSATMTLLARAPLDSISSSTATFPTRPHLNGHAPSKVPALVRPSHPSRRRPSIHHAHRPARRGIRAMWHLKPPLQISPAGACACCAPPPRTRRVWHPASARVTRTSYLLEFSALSPPGVPPAPSRSQARALGDYLLCVRLAAASSAVADTLPLPSSDPLL